MTALKVILITLAAAVVGFAGLHVAALVGVFFYSQAAAKSEAAPPTAAQEATPAPMKDSAPTYVVKKGDTLVKIARAHGVSPEALAKLNQIDHPDKIQLAQVLQLPRKNQPPP